MSPSSELGSQHQPRIPSPLCKGMKEPPVQSMREEGAGVGVWGQREPPMPHVGAMGCWGAYLTFLSLRFLVGNGDGHNYLTVFFKVHENT